VQLYVLCSVAYEKGMWSGFMTDIYVENDALSIARVVGKSIAGSLGERAFEELELAFATRILPRFTDDPVIRVNQNILLYWKKGYFKSKILEVFSQTIPLNHKVVDITSLTHEKIFGSIDEKKRHIAKPTFTNDVHFVVVSELTSLLGQHDFMRHCVNLMNGVLEGEKVSRQTLKLANAELSEVDLVELATKGVSYDPDLGELSYRPNVCVFAASRPLDNRYFTYLDKSGHLSRYHVVQRRISDEEAKKYFYEEYKLDQEALNQLKAANSVLSTVKVKNLIRPPESLMRPVYDRVAELAYDETAERHDTEFADIITPRVKGDIIRELVVHAFLRTAAQNGFAEIEELQYTQEDVDFVLQRPYHFIEFALNPIIVEDFSKIPKIKKRDKLKSAIMAYLNDGAERNINEILKAVTTITNCPATVYLAMNELFDEGKVTQTRHGYYKIVKKEEGVVEGEKK
jgi:hypothetical protein